MTPLKIVHVITALELGGAQKHVLDVVRQLDKDRYQVFLVSSPGGLLTDEARRTPAVTFYELSWLQRSINIFSDIFAFFWLLRFFMRERPHIVHTHSSKAGILGRFAAFCAGVPRIVHTVHGFGFHDHQPYILRATFIFLEYLAAKISYIIFVSYENKKRALAGNIGRPGKTCLIPYGIDPLPFYDRYDRREARRVIGVAEDVPLVGMIGCFKPQKAPLDFVASCSLIAERFPSANFILVGDGILRPQIEACICEYGLASRFFLLGWRRDIPQILAALDIFVLTSLWEGLPIVFLEALAAARVVVATRVGGAEDIIHHGVNGFLFEPGDRAACAEHVGMLLEDPEQARRMGIAGQQIFMKQKQFHRSDMMSALERVYGDS